VVGEFCDESTNCTVSGTVPVEAFEINDATGTAPMTGAIRNRRETKRRKIQSTCFVFIMNQPFTFPGDSPGHQVHPAAPVPVIVPMLISPVINFSPPIIAD
jgi:hypothetical protein